MHIFGINTNRQYFLYYDGHNDYDDHDEDGDENHEYDDAHDDDDIMVDNHDEKKKKQRPHRRRTRPYSNPVETRVLLLYLPRKTRSPSLLRAAAHGVHLRPGGHRRQQVHGRHQQVCAPAC